MFFNLLSTLLASHLCSQHLHPVKGLTSVGVNCSSRRHLSYLTCRNQDNLSQQLVALMHQEQQHEVQLQDEATSSQIRLRIEHENTLRRRSFLNLLLATPTALIASSPKLSNAIPFLDGPNRRQLELCLVTILRTQFWAMNVAKSIKTKLLTAPTNSNEDTAEEVLTENQRKLPYLEARLGAKALLTQKIGGGATNNVVKLASFNLKECLEDGKYWCNQLAKTNQLAGGKRICTDQLTTISDDMVESLASLVEFDGLETTIDPSPRSSLMLSMYNPQKGTFVYRTLSERVIPACERYLSVFEDRRGLCLEFLRRDYSDEVPFEVLASLYESESS